jgi:hypothetical protein
MWPYWIVYTSNMTDVTGGTETAYYSEVNGVTPCLQWVCDVQSLVFAVAFCETTVFCLL